MVIIRRTNTKERILEESLKLFSTFGYNAVGVEMIAAAVKVTPPSLYKHFKGKREILETIIDKSEDNYKAHIMPFVTHSDEELEKLTKEQFVKYVMDHVDNVLHDEYIRCVRKLFILEQYRNEKLRLMHIEKTYDRVERATVELLGGLLKNKKIAQPSHTIEHMANMFYLPIIEVINRCYCQPEYESKALEFIKDHCEILWSAYFE